MHLFQNVYARLKESLNRNRLPVILMTVYLQIETWLAVQRIQLDDIHLGQTPAMQPLSHHNPWTLHFAMHAAVD